MANTIITPSVMARAALATLIHKPILAALVNRDYESDFQGKQGDTITVRKPAVFTVNEFNRGSGIVVQNATEGSFTVTLNTIPDVSFAVTAEELTLKVDQFDERFLAPAMSAIAEYLDAKIAELLVDTARGGGGGGLVDGSGAAANRRNAFLQARAKLGRAKAPLENRYAVLSPEAVAEIGEDDLFIRADASGDTQMLRNANLGRIQGFDTYETGVIGGDAGPGAGGTRGEADGIAFHRDAVTLVTRTLAPPMGVAPNMVAVEQYGGLGLRVVQSYDQTYKQDVVSIDLLYGIAAGEDRENMAIEMEFGQGS